MRQKRTESPREPKRAGVEGSTSAASDEVAGSQAQGAEAIPVEEGEDPPADAVQCRICGEYFNAITESHLRMHDTTIEEYRGEFGEDVPLRPAS